MSTQAATMEYASKVPILIILTSCFKSKIAARTPSKYQQKLSNQLFIKSKLYEKKKTKITAHLLVILLIMCPTLEYGNVNEQYPSI